MHEKAGAQGLLIKCLVSGIRLLNTGDLISCLFLTLQGTFLFLFTNTWCITSTTYVYTGGGQAIFFFSPL